MSKLIKLLIVVVLFGVGSQVFGQDAYDTPEERDRKIQIQEQREQRIANQSMMYKRQQMKRFHMMDSEDRREFRIKRYHLKKHQMKKKKQKRIVTLMVVGVTSYVIGYEMAKDEHRYKKHGWETKPSDNWRK
tara:strand:+ start:58 stop:453 length:396 start_codon:yes stop_codon:yes gene_type:complete